MGGTTHAYMIPCVIKGFHPLPSFKGAFTSSDCQYTAYDSGPSSELKNGRKPCGHNLLLCARKDYDKTIQTLTTSVLHVGHAIPGPP